MTVPVSWTTRKFLGYNVAQWSLIIGLLLFGASAIEGAWDVYVRVGIAVLILDRLYS